MQDSRERFIRLLILVVFAQFVVIAVLLGGLSNDYLTNAYEQTWVTRNAPILGILLHGELDALVVGLAVGATALLIQQRLRDSKADPGRKPDVMKIVPAYLPAQPSIFQDNPLPDRVPPSRKKDPPKETAEDIHRELEKTEI